MVTPCINNAEPFYYQLMHIMPSILVGVAQFCLSSLSKLHGYTLHHNVHQLVIKGFIKDKGLAGFPRRYDSTHMHITRKNMYDGMGGDKQCQDSNI